MMKNKLILVILALAIVLGCSDALDLSNNNATSTSNFGSSPDQVEAAVNGAFHPITNTFFWGRIIHTGALLRSDEFNIIPFGSNTAMSTFLGNPGDRWATEPWQELYKSISRCNNIIANVDENGIPDDEIRNALVGQAYFLRAFDYWYLVNLYRNVPLITEPQSLDDLFVFQADPINVWDQIITDLEMAEDLLPDTWTGDNLGRPTSGAATALKGKSYLYQGNWQEAANALTEVVNSGQYSLLPADRYDENFSTTNENNSESVFELQYLGQESFIWGVDVAGTGSMGNYHIDYAPPSKSPDRSHIVNPWLRDLFDANNDVIRRNESIVFDYPGATGYGGTDYLTDFTDDIAVANDQNMEPIFTKKYAGLDLGTRAEVDFLGTNVGNNWRIIRYADVLLMLAEAVNELNRTTDAAALVDQVRARANLAPIAGTIASQEDMFQAIVDERAMELAMEGHRFFDLVRWGLADDYLGPNSLHGDHPKSLSGGVFETGKHELLWIPNSERDANDNLDQNPGYN